MSILRSSICLLIVVATVSCASQQDALTDSERETNGYPLLEAISDLSELPVVEAVTEIHPLKFLRKQITEAFPDRFPVIQHRATESSEDSQSGIANVVPAVASALVESVEQTIATNLLLGKLLRSGEEFFFENLLRNGEELFRTGEEVIVGNLLRTREELLRSGEELLLPPLSKMANVADEVLLPPLTKVANAAEEAIIPPLTKMAELADEVVIAPLTVVASAADEALLPPLSKMAEIADEVIVPPIAGIANVANDVLMTPLSKMADIADDVLAPFSQGSIVGSVLSPSQKNYEAPDVSGQGLLNLESYPILKTFNPRNPLAALMKTLTANE